MDDRDQPGPAPAALSGRRPPGRPAAEAAPRRRRILDAATELFITGGFAGTTIDDVARRSGLNKRTIYALVGGKEQLFREACRHVAVHGGLDLGDAIDPSSLRESLMNLGRRLLDNSLAPQTIALERATIAAAPLFPDFVDEVVASNYAEANAKVARFMADLHRLGLARIADELAASELFFDLVVGQIAHRMILGQECGIPRRRHLEQRIELFMRYLSA